MFLLLLGLLYKMSYKRERFLSVSGILSTFIRSVSMFARIMCADICTYTRSEVRHHL